MTDGSQDDLAKLLGALAIKMQSQDDKEATLQSIVEGAVDIVPGAHWAGISLISKHSVEARVPSDPLVGKLDELQSELGEGPCLSALREHHTVVIDDMITESRWPRFCALAADLGVRSLMSFQLFVSSQNLGALNLYADQIHAFTDDSRFIGELLAQHASVALIGSAAETQFNDALSSRDAIGQAKGIIMERFNVDEFAAFDLLRRLSQQSNEKLVDLARKLNQTRGHPDQP